VDINTKLAVHEHLWLFISEIKFTSYRNGSQIYFSSSLCNSGLYKKKLHCS